MSRSTLAFVLAAALAVPGLAGAGSRGGGHSSHSSGSHSSGSSHYSHASSSSHHSSSSSSHHSTTHYSSSSSHHTKSSSNGTHRTSHGTTKRDPEQRAKFMRSHPCPSTGKTHGACPGYVVDHVKALKHGGRDDPSNMQWQTKEAAKAKDKWE